MKCKWGILGCAAVAEQAVIPGIHRSRNGIVQAIASRSLNKAEEFARRFDIETAYGSYEQLLEDPDVQAVYVPLPNSLHKEWTIKAAQNGKQVLCEKPLACNAREARQMIDACQKHGVALMEAFAPRFQPQSIKVKELIDGGTIGSVFQIFTSHSCARFTDDDIRSSKELCGGVLMDIGCYCIDTARFLLGTEPVSVLAEQDIGERGVDDRTTAAVRFPGGVVLLVDTNQKLAPGCYEQEYIVYGEKGKIRVPTGYSQVETYLSGKLVSATFYLHTYPDREERIQTLKFKPVHHYQLEVEYFADRILNHEPIEFPAGNGLANMKVIDAIVQSARTGKLTSIS